MNSTLLKQRLEEFLGTVLGEEVRPSIFDNCPFPTF
jgi:hypothetical protein